MKTSMKTTPKRNVVLMYVFSGVFLVSAIFVANWQLSSQSERSSIKSSGQKTTALVVSRREVQFNTYEGQITTKPIVAPLKGTLKRYDIIEVFYDKQNPKRVVLNQDDTGFNVTMWIVVTKLFGASLILGYFGYRKQKNKPIISKKEQVTVN